MVGTIPANALYQVRPDNTLCKVWVGWGVSEKKWRSLGTELYDTFAAW